MTLLGSYHDPIAGSHSVSLTEPVLCSWPVVAVDRILLGQRSGASARWVTHLYPV